MQHDGNTLSFCIEHDESEESNQCVEHQVVVHLGTTTPAVSSHNDNRIAKSLAEMRDFAGKVESNLLLMQETSLLARVIKQCSQCELCVKSNLSVGYSLRLAGYSNCVYSFSTSSL